MVSVIKETKQDEMTLWLLGHLTILCHIFQGPLCGVGSHISKILNAREKNSCGTTCRDKESNEKCFFLLLFTLEGSVAFKTPVLQPTAE